MPRSNLEARHSQVIVEAEAELGWKLVSTRRTLYTLSYVFTDRFSIRWNATGVKFVTLGSVLPLAFDDDLQRWYKRAPEGNRCLKAHGHSTGSLLWIRVVTGGCSCQWETNVQDVFRRT
jgi:hypothetical protein